LNFGNVSQDDSIIDMREINHRVYAVDTPFASYDTQKNTDGSKFMYTSMHNDIGTLNMRIDEYEDGLTLKYLLGWQKLMKTSDGFANPPVMYKGKIRVIRLTSIDSDIHVHDYINYFPNEISPSSYSYDSSAVMQYNVTFTGDDVKHTLIPAAMIREQVNRMQQTIMGNDPVDPRRLTQKEILGYINKAVSFFI